MGVGLGIARQGQDCGRELLGEEVTDADLGSWDEWWEGDCAGSNSSFVHSFKTTILKHGPALWLVYSSALFSFPIPSQ